MRRTKIIAVNVFKVFGLSDQHLNAHALRLAVLYEDLALEVKASHSHDLKTLEAAGFNFRRFYFMRKAIGTAYEFAEAVRLLNEFPAFADVKKRFKDEHVKKWDECVAFYAANEKTIKAIRHDIGGHFGYRAALYATRNLHDAGDGLMEFTFDEVNDETRIRLGLAEQVVASAMSSQRKERGRPSREYFAEVFTLLNDAFRHAMNAAQMIAGYYILDRIVKSR